MDKKLKKIFIIVFIILIINIVLISIYLYIKNRENTKIQIDANKIIEMDEAKKPNIIENLDELYDVANCVTSYYSYLNKSKYTNFKGDISVNINYIKKQILDILSPRYVQENGISENNIFDKLPDLNIAYKFIPIDAKVDYGEGKNRYLVYGNLVNINNKIWKKEICFVNVDKTNRTYSIEPIKYEEDLFNNISVKVDFEEIAPNKNNKFYERYYSKAEILKYRFYNFKDLLLLKSEDAYKMLNQEYRQKRFGSYKKFVEYVDLNYKRLSTITPDKIKIKNENSNELNEYIYLDKEGFYYIFKETSFINQEIILDTYTIELPEFKEKYNKANDGKKVGYNIEKFFSALNQKDYDYCYNVLDPVFRKNNYLSKDDFIKVMKNTFYAVNKVEHENVEKKGNNFVYDITVKNAKNIDENDSMEDGKKMTIIMQLKDKYGYVMSFSFK